MSHRSQQAGDEAPIAPSPIQAKAQVFIAALASVERKRLFVACLLLFAAANALAAVAGDIWTMAVARFVPALALPVCWAMASETAAHLTGPSREGRAVALVFFDIVAATVLGIPIGTLIADAWGWRLAFATLAALALAKALLLAARLPRIPGRPGVSLRSQASVLRQPLVPATCCCRCWSSPACSPATPTWPTSSSAWPASAVRWSAGR